MDKALRGGTDAPSSMTCDARDNVYLYGNFGGAYWARYDSDGDFIWGGSPGTVVVQNMATDDSSYVYLVGSFANTATFGSTGTTITETAVPGDAYIVRFDSLGNALKLWRSEGSGAAAGIYGLSIRDSIMYATGTFIGEAVMGDTINAVYSGGDIFLAKLSPKILTGTKNPFTENNTVFIYPNPFSTSATFYISNGEGKAYTLSVYNSIGQNISISRFTGKEFTLDAQNFSKGIYLYVLTDEKGNSGTGKIIRE
jgi:hypothetical protein